MDPTGGGGGDALVTAPGTMLNQCKALSILSPVISASKSLCSLPASEPKGAREVVVRPPSKGRCVGRCGHRNERGKYNTRRMGHPPSGSFKNWRVPLRSGISFETGAKREGVEKAAGFSLDLQHYGKRIAGNKVSMGSQARGAQTAYHKPKTGNTSRSMQVSCLIGARGGRSSCSRWAKHKGKTNPNLPPRCIPLIRRPQQHPAAVLVLL